jgi:hypothetical protein
LVDDSATTPKVPVLVPPPRLRLNALLLSPVSAFPAASVRTKVSTSVALDATVADAKVAEDLDALMGPALTVILGLLVSVMPFTTAVKVVGVPAVVPVKMAV